MENEGDELIPTKASLLGRLKNPNDQASWQEFFDTYSNLIYGVARKAGLNDAAAKDVLEATMEAVAQHLPKFRYDPAIGSFKDWLQKLIRLQIISRSLKRRPAIRAQPASPTESHPSGKALDQVWEAEWKTNLHHAAIANVKRRLDPKKFQIYDLQVNKHWPAEKIAALMSLSVEEVITAKLNIAEMIHAEVKRLEERMV